MDAVPRIWRFGNAVLDERTQELHVGGQLVPLDPSHIAMLRYFLAHPGEVIFKDRLAAALWPGRKFNAASVTKCIAVLRQALGGEQQTILTTAPGYGYRLTPPVRTESAVPASQLPDSISEIAAALGKPAG